MRRVEPLASKESKLVIGLMSGTSCDGIDASLVRIVGSGLDSRVEELGFVFLAYEESFRQRLLLLAQGQGGGGEELLMAGLRLGELFVQAAKRVCDEHATPYDRIDLIGSHGHTLYHLPQSREYFDSQVRGTLQVGEASLLAEAFGCAVVSDFRVRDMAAGGQGAPLVPYCDYLLFRDTEKDVALLNLGGIGNITIVPKACRPEEVVAFDTGPGNMVIDALVWRYSDGLHRFDEGGSMARGGAICYALLSRMEATDDYLSLPLPKTTGRERYGELFVEALEKKRLELSISESDLLATVTEYTALCVLRGLERFARRMPDRLVVSGGGSHNTTLLLSLRHLLPHTEVLTQEDLGHNSDSKEAVAFAVLANESVCGKTNTLVGATGASHPVVMGKILLC
ncbi:MAG: anhydro-N-acetylmuramic acid kinase [Sphaerochaeta sp.]|nr:anhydro-N-acetylmuramic acid kinase [Sphaerochaeta sp.]